MKEISRHCEPPKAAKQSGFSTKILGGSADLCVGKIRLLRRYAPRNDAIGSVLVASIWLVSLLSITAASMGFEASQHILLMKREIELMEEKVLFTSALNSVKELILSDPYPHEDSVLDKWYGNQMGSDPEGVRPLSVRQAGLQVLSVEDEESKINLNYASENLLKVFFDLLKQKNMALENADTKAWIRRLMELRETENVISLDELYLWKEIPPSELNKILPYITVAPPSGQINLNTASPLVLEAYLKSVGGDEYAKKEILKKILEDRKRSSSIQSTDLHPAAFTKRLDLDETPQMLYLVQQFLNGITTDSMHYRVKIRLPSKTAEAIIKEMENFKFEVLSWHEE